MIWVAVLLAFAGPPFWETKPVRQWSQDELHELLHDSPWARPAVDASSVFGGVQTYLASSRIVQEAEAEMARRRGKAKAETASNSEEPEEGPDDYREFLKENAGKSLVLAVHYPDTKPLANSKEAQLMENECIMKIGRKKYKMQGHFPPPAATLTCGCCSPSPSAPAISASSLSSICPGPTAPSAMSSTSSRNWSTRASPTTDQ
ncbi:MAG: hypothetical protein HY013_13485 [Candidatus Solibacter usitatus]|nr:hypothetical protein [Candidatus Solibacter usitatus]